MPCEMSATNSEMKPSVAPPYWLSAALLVMGKSVELV